MTWLTRVVLVLLVTCTIWAGIKAIRWMEIDRCLDAGGAYHYDVDACEQID